MTFPFATIDPTLLATEPPRRVPFALLVKITRVTARQHPPSPMVLLLALISGGVVWSLLTLSRLGKNPWIGIGGGVVASGGVLVWDIGKRVWADSTLLRHGRMVDAEIVQVRPAFTTQGRRKGSLVDVVIPVEPNQLSAGSFWIANEDETTWRLTHTHIRVLCLPYVPGTWHVLEATLQDTVPHELSWNQSTAQWEPNHR